MADNNALVLSDNENGTQSATWTPVEEITPGQKVLIGNVDSLSGTVQATWNPSFDAAVFKDGTFTENGVYDAQEDDCDGYKTVTVEVPEPVLGTKTITANDTYVAADEDKDGFSSVTVNVTPTLQDKTVTPSTSEQTITADEGKDGLGTVTVSAVTAAIDANIIAENIKSGVTILGVEGTYTGE